MAIERRLAARTAPGLPMRFAREARRTSEKRTKPRPAFLSYSRTCLSSVSVAHNARAKAQSVGCVSSQRALTLYSDGTQNYTRADDTFLG